jgi:beta-glucosidase
VLVTFTLSNTGQRAGADVAQVYVGDPAATGEPPRQLKGFNKVSLDPGESRQLRIWLPAVSFAYWDTGLRTWKVDAGNYQIYVGDSSANLPLRTRVHRVAAKLAPGSY